MRSYVRYPTASICICIEPMKRIVPKNRNLKFRLDSERKGLFQPGWSLCALEAGVGGAAVFVALPAAGCATRAMPDIALGGAPSSETGSVGICCAFCAGGRCWWIGLRQSHTLRLLV